MIVTKLSQNKKSNKESVEVRKLRAIANARKKVTPAQAERLDRIERSKELRNDWEVLFNNEPLIADQRNPLWAGIEWGDRVRLVEVILTVAIRAPESFKEKRTKMRANKDDEAYLKTAKALRRLLHIVKLYRDVDLVRLLPVLMQVFMANQEGIRGAGSPDIDYLQENISAETLLAELAKFYEDRLRPLNKRKDLAMPSHLNRKKLSSAKKDMAELDYVRRSVALTINSYFVNPLHAIVARISDAVSDTHPPTSDDVIKQLVRRMRQKSMQ